MNNRMHERSQLLVFTSPSTPLELSVGSDHHDIKVVAEPVEIIYNKKISATIQFDKLLKSIPKCMIFQHSLNCNHFYLDVSHVFRSSVWNFDIE